MVAKETAEAMNCFERIDFLDDNNDLAIGIFSEYEKYVTEYSYAFVALDNSEFRLDWIRKLEESLFSIVILVAPSAYVSPSAQIQKGSIVEPKAVIQTNAVLAIGVIVSAGAIVNYNSFVGDGCHIGCGAVVEANSIVFSSQKVKSGTVYTAKEAEKQLNGYSFEIGV